MFNYFNTLILLLLTKISYFNAICLNKTDGICLKLMFYCLLFYSLNKQARNVSSKQPFIQAKYLCKRCYLYGCSLQLLQIDFCNQQQDNMMTECSPSSVKKYTKQEQPQVKLNARESLESSRNSSKGKFLKRKPDLKQLLIRPSSKRKRQTSIHQYYQRESCIDTCLDNQKPKQLKFGSECHIHDVYLAKDNLLFMDESPSKILQSVRSQSNLTSRKKSFQIQASIVKYKKMEWQDFEKETPLQKEMNIKKGHIDINTRIHKDYAHFGPSKQVTPKKSKTQFFNTEQSQTYIQRNKRLQEEIDLYMEKEYLLQTEKNHLVQVIKDKDRDIDKLENQKSNLIVHYMAQIQKQAYKWIKQTQQLKETLLKVNETVSNLKEQNNFIRQQLICKNEQLEITCERYNDLQHLYYEQQKQTLAQLDNMKQQMKKPREDSEELNEYYEQKWREKLLKLQQQIKYLTIQNQCQLIFKDQLRKAEIQNRRLRDERDYFKKKILDNVKRNQRSTRTKNQDSSLLFQLSDASVQSTIPE